MIRDPKKYTVLRPPTENGCWFCWDYEDGPIAFDVEFDTWVHPACIQKALAAPESQFKAEEASIMSYLLEAP